MSWQRLCGCSELLDGQAREFTLQGPEGEEGGFALRHLGRFYAYINSCPHTGMALNWQPDQFFTLEGDLLECALHGALFGVADGLCLRGPCRGEPLTPLGVRIVNDEVWVPTLREES